ncbi:1-aminocyclopropane-1-carboxylate deaminase/D-cysteine desulfhydrase [Oceanospirillum sp.]|uniref:1-aminocyclopropane-1-carboxylate deaminase/D-cysteine desulfhydrase n=1 Tax=Oceanospirillum sp. TaxID=2021254 RepID=UPI003A92919C
MYPLSTPTQGEPFQVWLDCLVEPELQSLQHPLLTEMQVELCILRTDNVHPVISGNKAYKLKYNLKAALEQGATGILSFGGAWSNHLHALAYSCHLLQLPCVAVIRGEQELATKSAMLQDLKMWGTQLHFINRQDYRLRNNLDWLKGLTAGYPGYFVVPEGGSSALAAPGITELSHQLESECERRNWQPDQLWCAVGTGGTLAGLIAGRKKDYRIIGVPVLKGGEFLIRDIDDRLLSDSRCGIEKKNWELLLDGHFGGYAKVSSGLLQQMAQLSAEIEVHNPGLSLPMDPVYTGKLFCRFWQSLQAGEFRKGCRILLIHSGGLQGRRGYGLSEAMA